MSVSRFPNPTNVGDLIQGNFIGQYLAYPVDPTSGNPLPAPNSVELIGQGNTQQGVVLGSANSTVGGTDPQDDNVIDSNGAQGSFRDQCQNLPTTKAPPATRYWVTRSAW